MQIQKLHLQTFRGYHQALFTFEQPVTILVGANGIGKTTIIEAVQALSSAGSFRASKVEEMVQFGQELGRVSGLFTEGALDEPASDNEKLKLELTVTIGQVQGKKTHKRLYTVNGAKKRQKDFVGRVVVVTFRPEDMRLVEGSPGRRRGFLDEVLEVADEKYAYASKQYLQVLRRRNKMLEAVREGKAPRNTLDYWNQNLIKFGEYLQTARRQFITFCNEQDFMYPFKMEYLPKEISEKRIDQYLDRAIAAGHTLIGPHKDDFEVTLPTVILQQHLQGTPKADSSSEENHVSLSAFGSRGQQRLGVLWLKLCQITYLEQKRKTKAIILLDDILSELDEEARDLVWELISDRQMIITTAQPELLPTAWSKSGMIQTIDLETRT